MADSPERDGSGRVDVVTAGAGRVLFVLANVVGVIAFLWPFILPGVMAGSQAHAFDAPIVFVLLLVCISALLFLELGRGGMGPKVVALIAVLAAAMIALRLPGFVFGFSAMFIVVLVAGNAFGSGFGFLLGAIGTFASGLFIGGLGPWLPFQMVAVGWVGAGAGLVPRSPRWAVRLGLLSFYGFIAGFLFGAVINLWFWPFAAGSSEVGWRMDLSSADNFFRYVRFYAATSLFWDSFRAVGNALLVLLVGRPLLGALDRAARRLHIEFRSVGDGAGITNGS